MMWVKRISVSFSLVLLGHMAFAMKVPQPTQGSLFAWQLDNQSAQSVSVVPYSDFAIDASASVSNDHYAWLASASAAADKLQVSMFSQARKWQSVVVPIGGARLDPQSILLAVYPAQRSSAVPAATSSSNAIISLTANIIAKPYTEVRYLYNVTTSKSGQVSVTPLAINPAQYVLNALACGQGQCLAAVQSATGHHAVSVLIDNFATGTFNKGVILGKGAQQAAFGMYYDQAAKGFYLLSGAPSGGAVSSAGQQTWQFNLFKLSFSDSQGVSGLTGNTAALGKGFSSLLLDSGNEAPYADWNQAATFYGQGDQLFVTVNYQKEGYVPTASGRSQAPFNVQDIFSTTVSSATTIWQHYAAVFNPSHPADNVPFDYSYGAQVGGGLLYNTLHIFNPKTNALTAMPGIMSPYGPVPRTPGQVKIVSNGNMYAQLDGGDLYQFMSQKNTWQAVSGVSNLNGLMNELPNGNLLLYPMSTDGQPNSFQIFNPATNKVLSTTKLLGPISVKSMMSAKGDQLMLWRS